MITEILMIVGSNTESAGEEEGGRVIATIDHGAAPDGIRYAEFVLDVAKDDLLNEFPRLRSDRARLRVKMTLELVEAPGDAE